MGTLNNHRFMVGFAATAGLGVAPVASAGGFGGFAPQVVYPTGEGPVSIVAADFDGDGFADLATADRRSGAGDTVSVLMNNGDGTFAPPAMLDVEPINGNLNGVAAADLDSDGDVDLATSNTGNPATVSVLLNNGDGSFAPAQQFESASGPTWIAASDLDGDGDIDLAVANGSFSDIVVVHENAGDATFENFTTFPTGIRSGFVTAGDLDDDGDNDLTLGRNSNGSDFSIVLNNGDGTFDPPDVITTDQWPSAIAIADIDASGTPDLAVARRQGNDVHTLLNTGEASFTFGGEHAVTGNPKSIAAADFDADDDIDLVTTGDFTSDTVSVLLNTGDGSFEDQQNFATGVRPRAVVAADLDGNASTDLAVANRESDDVSVLLNQTVTSAPGEFALLAPADGATGLPLPQGVEQWPSASASLDWAPAAGFSVTYTVTVALDPMLNDVVLEETGLTATNFALPVETLQADTTHHWSVTAVNAVGQTPSTPESFSFTTGAGGPPTPDLNGDGVVDGADLGLLLGAWGDG